MRISDEKQLQVHNEIVQICGQLKVDNDFIYHKDAIALCDLCIENNIKPVEIGFRTWGEETIYYYVKPSVNVYEFGLNK